MDQEAPAEGGREETKAEHNRMDRWQQGNGEGDTRITLLGSNCKVWDSIVEFIKPWALQL